MSGVIDSLERAQLRKVPAFQPGDRVRVHFQVVEGNRRRTQVFEGVVIRRQGSGVRETFTVRKLSFGVGVERTFPVHSPKIERIEVAARGDVRRAKLYYLRGRVGRRARVRERRYVAGGEEVIVEVEAPMEDAEGVQVAAETEASPEDPDAEAATVDDPGGDPEGAGADALQDDPTPETGEAPEGEGPAAGEQAVAEAAAEGTGPAEPAADEPADANA